MKDKVFLDSNVLVYLYSITEPAKQSVSRKVIAENDCFTSVQALNEFSNVCLKKWSIGRQSIENAINEICRVCKVAEVGVKTVKSALYLQEKYRYSYYDSLMLACAIEIGCEQILTEDMHDGQIIESVLKVVNVYK